MSKQIIKKEDGNNLEEINPDVILGGVVSEGRDLKTGEIIKIEDTPRDYQSEIEKIPEGERIQEVEMFNTATGRKEIVTIDRRGMFDEKLGMILSNKDSTMDSKLSAMSLWLFERGRESGSFIIDVIQAKGQFMKGAQKFKSQIRFDFTIFMETFCNYLEGNAQTVIDYLMPGKKALEVEREAFDYLKKNKEKTLKDFVQENIPPHIYTSFLGMSIELALRDQSEAQLIRKRIYEMAEEREKESGKGIYLTTEGKATSNINESNNKPKVEEKERDNGK